MKSFKELLQSVKEAFNADPNAAAPAAAATVTLSSKTYKLSDGAEISVTQAGETIAVGDSVMANGVPVAEGVYVLENGSSITVDATGKITLIIEPAPATTDLNQNTAAPVVPAAPTVVQASADVPKTQEEIQAMLAKFADGTPEERIANLEVVCKALMEQCFGWQLREAQQKALADQAIAVYKTGLSAAEKTITKHEETIKGIFSLMDQIVETPSADPATLTGNKKDKFDKTEKREDRMKRIAEAIKKEKS